MPSRRLLLIALPVAFAQPCCCPPSPAPSPVAAPSRPTASGCCSASTPRASTTCGCRTGMWTGRPARSTSRATAGRRPRIAAPSPPPLPSSSASTSCARPSIRRCCWPTPRCAGCRSTAPRRAGAACPTRRPPSRAPTSATWWSPSSRIPTAPAGPHRRHPSRHAGRCTAGRGGPRRHAGRRHQRALAMPLRRAFSHHHGAWPDQIRYFEHAIAWSS